MRFEPPRDTWPPGPWDSEPAERVDFTTQAGYSGLLHRNLMGGWCGYVGVPVGHPLHNHAYGQCIHGCSPDGPPERLGASTGDALLDKVLEAVQPLSERLYARGFRQWECTMGKHLSPQELLTCHGGITYADSCSERICHPGDEPLWWFGFDCAHGGDVLPGMLALHHKMAQEALAKGNADAFELWSNRPAWPWGESYKDVSFVMEETEALAAQLKEIEELGPFAYHAIKTGKEALDG